MADYTAEIIVIGSGAGGATVAATLAQSGRDVLLLEEGPPSSANVLESHSPPAMQAMYRDGGIGAISAQTRIAYVEGRTVGGSTEINSGFWHRLPPSILAGWQVDYGLKITSDDHLEEKFEELESELGLISIGEGRLPPSSEVFRAGLEKLGWDARETPRIQRGDPAASQFSLNAKSTMSVTMIPKALSAGARLISDCKVSKIIRNGATAKGVQATVGIGRNATDIVIDAKFIWVCGGATQTPLLLSRSGIKRNVGKNLQIHPMIKIAAEFEQQLNAHESVMPVFQIRDYASDVFIGGSVFTPGFLAMALADSGSTDSDALANWRNCGLFYVSVKSRGKGTIGTLPFSSASSLKFKLTDDDASNLTAGLSRLAEVLFTGGATRLFPGIADTGSWESIDQMRSDLSSPVEFSRMRLSTVHLTSSTPIGENQRVCAADSTGKLFGMNNVYIADASTVPSAPGVNPQGTVMALSALNSSRFAKKAVNK